MAVKVFELIRLNMVCLIQLPLYPAGESAIVGSQVFAALVVGLLTAFAFQLLLTTLGIAVGITRLGFHSPTDESSKLGDRISKVGTLTGLGILLTVNAVLFAACFLAAKFTQVTHPVSGAILGIVIWSAYFLILTWVSSAAVTAIVSSVLGSATAGFREIISVISAVQRQDNLPTPERPIDLVRQEVKAALAEMGLQKTVEASLEDSPLQPAQVQSEVWQQLEFYLHHTSAKKLTPERIDRKLQKLLVAQEEQVGMSLPKLDRQAVAALLDRRKGLDKAKKNQILEQIEATWSALAVDVVASETASGERVGSQVAAILQASLQKFDEQTLAQIQPDRLHQIGHDMVELLKSVQPLSETVQSVVVQSVEQIQQETQRRLEDMKQQTQKRVEETRKAASAAAWWLFAIVSTAAVTAASAGALATRLL